MVSDPGASGAAGPGALAPVAAVDAACARLIAAAWLICLALAGPLAAGPERSTGQTSLRLAVFHADLSRRGPGLLLRDLRADQPPADILRAAGIIRTARPDVLLLQGFDYDAGLAALRSFNQLIGNGTAAFAHLFALRPNTGMQTGMDLDGDGRTGGPRDAQGYGRFAGEGGMAVLSRWPLRAEADLSSLLWQDLPGADLPRHPDGSLFPSGAAFAVQRLPTTGHWALHLEAGSGLYLLAYHASPPGFDGAEDRGGRRARDEHRLWQAWLGGQLAQPPPDGPFVLMGTGNLDPGRGDGDPAFMAAFLSDPAWQDPAPLRGQPTAFWPTGPGALRVSYLLPSPGLRILAAGILPAAPGAATPGDGASAETPGLPPLVRHLVWLDLDLPGG